MNGADQESDSSRGKTAWVDSACAECPGFLVLGAAGALAPFIIQEPQQSAPELAFAYDPLEELLGSAATSSPATRAKMGRTRYKFLQYLAWLKSVFVKGCFFGF